MVNAMVGLVYTTQERRLVGRRGPRIRLKQTGFKGNCGCDTILEKYGFALLCWMLCFLSIMLSVIYYTADAGDINWKKLLFVQKVAPPRVEIDNIELGMTMTNVRQVHSNLSLIINGNGITKGSYVSNGSLYSVWFTGADGDKKVYRMRYDHIFRNIGETEIINKINRKYGRPASSDCRRNASTSANECRFKWWPNGGASLYVFVATSNDKTGAVITKVAMVATDTRLDSKRLRAASKNRRTPLTFSIANEGKPTSHTEKTTL